MTRPASASRGPSRRPSKGGGKGRSSSETGGKPKFDPTKTEFVGKDGIKKPICCNAFRNSGNCDYEKRTGKKCRLRHWTEAQYQAEIKRLNPDGGAAKQ